MNKKPVTEGKIQLVRREIPHVLWGQPATLKWAWPKAKVRNPVRLLGWQHQAPLNSSYITQGFNIQATANLLQEGGGNGYPRRWKGLKENKEISNLGRYFATNGTTLINSREKEGMSHGCLRRTDKVFLHVTWIILDLNALKALSQKAKYPLLGYIIKLCRRKKTEHPNLYGI